MIDVKNLSVYHQDKCLLNSINLTISNGQYYCLIGESGGGKSLLSKAMTGILPPTMETRGSVQSDFQKIDFILQNPRGGLQPNIPIGRQLIHTLSSYGFEKRNRDQYIRHILTSVNLDNIDTLLRKTPLQLSGGMCQKVAFATALFSQPDLLVADEITSALDQESQQEILGLLYKFYLNQERTILCITHDVDIARKYATHIGVIHQGELIESGEKNSILKHPKEEFTKELIASFEEFDSITRRTEFI